jgi:spermidine/putrescine transport system permease protein
LSWYEDLLKGGAALALSDTSSASMQVGLFQYVRNSLIVALSAMIISTTIGTLVALGMERYRFKLRNALDVVLYLPIIIPDVAMGIAMAVFFNLIFKILEQFTGIDAALGFPTIIISHVAFNISFVSVVVRARLAGMDPVLEEAAYDSGANEWQTFRRIILPLIAPGIIGGALLAFTLSLDDYVITFFTAGVGTSTLPIYVFGLVRFSVTPAINALSTLMMLFSMIIVTLSLAMQRR